MGYDTTLHLVDPRAFEYMEASVLNPDADDDLKIEIARLLGSAAEDERVAGGRLLAEVTLGQVSVLQPYTRERNIALSLLDGLPDRWIGSILDEMPRLRERFPSITVPQRFDGNFCTGVYVPPRHIMEVLGFVQNEMDFDRLCRVLHMALDRNLGYWEGTEVTVFDPPYCEWFVVD